jgi:hypothetical protein
MGEQAVGGVSSTQTTTAPRDNGMSAAALDKLKDGTTSPDDQANAAAHIANPQEFMRQLQQLMAHGKIAPGSATAKLYEQLRQTMNNVR